MSQKIRLKGWFVRSARGFPLLGKTLLLGLFALNGRSQAQDVVASPPSYSETPQALKPFTQTAMDVFTPAGTPKEQLAQPFRFKFLTLRPHADYRFTYASGILANPGQPVNTIIQQLSPGLRLDIGDHWVLDYTPTWTVYSSQQFQDTLNHSATLNWGTSYKSWVFGLSQSYAKSAVPQIETGTQTHQEVYSTTVDGTYTINSKMSLDLAVNQTFFSAEQVLGQPLQSYREWSTLDWLNYHFWTRFSIALGVGLGYDDVDASPDMLFERYQGRVRWRATDKISFQLHGGVEDRQFLSGGTSDILNPVFGGGIQYLPFQHTQISLNADRVVTVSDLQNDVTESIGFNGDLNQRLLGKLFLALSGGYRNIKYVNSIPSRSDDYYFFNVRLYTAFLKRGTLSIFYQISDNSSSSAQPNYSFSSHQAGFEISFAY